MLSDVRCGGWEQKLVDCPNATTSIGYCNHEYDVAVSCQGLCSTQGDLRLADGWTYAGRVQVCINGHWGTVCNNGWSGADSQVVCRQLGYTDSKYIRL